MSERAEQALKCWAAYRQGQQSYTGPQGWQSEADDERRARLARLRAEVGDGGTTDPILAGYILVNRVLANVRHGSELLDILSARFWLAKTVYEISEVVRSCRPDVWKFLLGTGVMPGSFIERRIQKVLELVELEIQTPEKVPEPRNLSEPASVLVVDSIG